MIDPVLRTELAVVEKQARCLYTEEAVEQALSQMAKKMTHRLADTNPIMLCVLIGGVVPLGRLLLHLSFPLEVQYIHATRYEGALDGGAHVSIRAKPACSLAGRHVVIVDDILDAGVTMAGIMDYCEAQGAEQVHTAVLVNRQMTRASSACQTPDFQALSVVDMDYLLGYGMDYKGYLRNLPGIYAIDVSAFAPNDSLY